MREKTAVITGCASGVGRATALHFLGKKWKVFAIDVNAEGLEGLKAAAAEIKKIDESLLTTYVCDLADQDSIAQTSEEIKIQLADLENGLDALINVAGVVFFSPVMGQEWKLVELTIKVNTFAPMLLTRHFFDLLIKGKHGGNLVNVSSMGGLVAWPWQGAYSVSKFGLEGFADSLRKELITAKMSKKLRISTINPGGIDSPMGQGMMAKGQKWIDANKDQHPIWAAGMERIVKRLGGYDYDAGEYPGGLSKYWFVVRPEKVARNIYKAASKKHPRYRYLVMAPVFRIIFSLQNTPTYISDKVSASVM